MEVGLLSEPNKLKRIETFMYILLIIQFLTLIAMFLVLQQVDKSVIEIKRFCWADKVVDDYVPDGSQPYLDIIH
jgi:hypothetical protein